MGPSIATEILLNSKLKNKYDLIHLDTSDRRDLKSLGAIDFTNIYLAIKHYFILLLLVITKKPVMVYIPISQTTIGYLRDAGFIIISKLFMRKVICHLRGGNFKNWYNSASFVTQWFIRRIHSLVDGQIVLGETLKHLFAGIINDEIIFVVPNGRNFNNTSNGAKHSDKFKILYFSNFIRTKGVLDALSAIPNVYKKYKQIECIFAGNWRDKETKREFELFLEKFPDLPVAMKGPIYGDEKYKLFASSDIFVFPTYYPAEGHPWVIVEAMAYGLPIISTDQGAITESVIDDVNGFIVDKQNPEQIAEKIKLLIENAELRIKMGRESRRLYEENFTEEKMVEKMTYAFNTVLSR
jgi:glycosyltransferase involved in cell wall biosynthesis